MRLRPLVLACALLMVVAQIAVAPATPSVSVTPSPATVQPAASATITAGMPVADAGTVSQEIVQTIDPTKAVLTGASSINKPVGWGLSYFDGTSWSNTTPATSSAWAQVTKVKTAGTINSQGSESGYQIATGTANGAVVNLTPPTIPAGGTGDGYQTFFDPGRTRVFNVFHHQSSGGQLDCHVLSTGNLCAGFPLNIMRTTPQYSTGRVVGTKIWIPGLKRIAVDADDTAGFYCVDISAVLASGGNPTMCSTPYVPLAGTGFSALEVGTGADYRLREFYAFDGVPTAGSESEGRLWAQVVASGNLVCLDTATAAPCAGMPTNGWPTAVKGWKLDSESYGGRRSSVVVSGGRIYTMGSTSNGNAVAGTLVIACNLVSNPATECPGFTGGKNLGGVLGSGYYGTYRPMIGRLVELPTAAGGTAGVCLLGDNRLVPNYSGSVVTRPQSSTAAVPCWDAAGSAFAGPATLSTMVTSSFTYGTSDYQWPLRMGSRIYWSNGVNWTTGGVEYPARAHCWDASVASGAGGPCANIPADGFVTDNYSVTPDPAIPDCMWVTRHDQPNLITYNMVGNVLGCSTIAPTRASFPGNTVVPRMACSSSPGAVRSWKTFTLTSPAPAANFSVILTVKDSNGMPIAGWTNIALTAGTALDLTSLSPSVTGVSPTFDVDFTITSGSISSATAEVKAVGDAPELCLTVEAKLSCPIAPGPGPIPPPGNATSMAILAEGSATDAQSQTTTFTPASGSLGIAAASVEQCSGTLGGRAVDTSPTPRPAVGVTVALLDSSGNALNYPTGHAQAGQPVTTTTDADGNYSFPGLSAASYKVRFVDSATATVVSSTVASGGSGTVSASGGAVVSNASAVTVGNTSTVNAIYTLAPVAPTRTATTGMNMAAVFDPFSASGSSAAANPSTGATFPANYKAATRLCNPSTNPPQDGTTVPCTLTTRVVAGQGTWSVNTDAGSADAGKITFTPDTGYVGAADPLSYGILDSASRRAAGALTPTVVGTPTAQPDTSTGPWDTNQAISVLTNDSAASGASLVAATVKLCPNPQPAAPYTASNCNLSTLAISNEGTYTANANGTVTFDPLPSFSGQVPTPVRYVVQDNATQVASALITPTVSAPALPVATPETKPVIPGATATFANLITGQGALATGSGLQTGNTNGPCLIDPSDSVCKATFAIAGEGTWTVNRTTGVATFQALNNATAGTKTPVTYRVTDAVGQTATSTLTPTIPAPPTAAPDPSTGAVDINQAITPLANAAAGSGTTLVASTVRICTTATATGSCTGATLNISGEGTYTANNDGTVTFDPLPSFTGIATPIKYVVEDALGQKATSTITPEVVSIPAPVAAPDSTTGLPGATQLINPLANDAAGSASYPLSGTSVRLCGPSEVAPACAQMSLTTSDGVFTVNALTGFISFQPVSGMLGTAAAVTYAVTDGAFQRTSSTYTPRVVGEGPPQVAPAVVSVAHATPGTMAPQVTPGTAPSDPARSCLAAPGATCQPGETSISRPEGTYVLEPATGIVTFTPAAGYSGTPADPVRLCVTDIVGQSGCGTLTPTVAAAPLPPSQGEGGKPLPGAPIPSALPEVESTMAGQPVSVRPLANDSPSSGAMLDPSSLRLRDPRTGRYSDTVTIPGQGTFRVGDGGTVTFTPQKGFTGTTPAIGYRITDSLGRTATSTITIVVRDTPPPWADPQFEQAMRGQAVEFDPVASNDPGGAPFVAASMRIKDPVTGRWTTRVVVPGEGTWTVDPRTGRVRFRPLASFTGAATPVTYRIANARGQKVMSTLNPLIRDKRPALSITTRASHTTLRPGQRSLITLRIANYGLATTTRTITRAPIPRGFAVANPMGGTVSGGWIRFSTGNLKAGGATTRRFVLVATASGVGQGSQQVTGWATSTNTRSVNDPTALRVIGAVTGKAPVTG